MEFVKPCPWCGFGPILKRDPLFTNYTYNGQVISRGYVNTYKYYYQCSNDSCGATAPHGEFNTIYDSEEIAKRKARESWNSRA